MSQKDVLYYAGEGRFLIGIPSTDLTPDELEATAARLNQTAAQIRRKALASGIYSDTSPKSRKPPAIEESEPT